MTSRYIDPHHYLVITNTGRAIAVRIKRDGKRIMAEALNLDFTHPRTI